MADHRQAFNPSIFLLGTDSHASTMLDVGASASAKGPGCHDISRKQQLRVVSFQIGWEAKIAH